MENEVSQCEATLKDEVDKRRKYKIDASRRTHNYDQFICTFLSMLAEQGHVTALVEQHLNPKKRPSAAYAPSANSKLHKNGDKQRQNNTKAKAKRKR